MGREGRARRRKNPALCRRERAVLDRLRYELEVPREVAERLERYMSFDAASPAVGSEEPTEN